MPAPTPVPATKTARPAPRPAPSPLADPPASAYKTTTMAEITSDAMGGSSKLPGLVAERKANNLEASRSDDRVRRGLAEEWKFNTGINNPYYTSRLHYDDSLTQARAAAKFKGKVMEKANIYGYAVPSSRAFTLKPSADANVALHEGMHASPFAQEPTTAWSYTAASMGKDMRAGYKHTGEDTWQNYMTDPKEVAADAAVRHADMYRQGHRLTSDEAAYQALDASARSWSEMRGNRPPSVILQTIEELREKDPEQAEQYVRNVAPIIRLARTPAAGGRDLSKVASAVGTLLRRLHGL